MKRKLLAAVIALAALVAALIGAGYLLPVAHVATVHADLRAPRDAVWSTIRTPGAYPDWREDVSEVVIAAGGGGEPQAWIEKGPHGDIPVRIVEESAPSLLVTRIDAEPSELPFGGRWIYVLSTDGGATRVTLTEEGEVYNPLFRLMSRFVFGHTATMEQYLRALGKRHGEDVTPTVVENRR